MAQVLIIDSSQVARQVLEKVVRDEGHTAVFSHDPVQALMLIYHDVPDTVVIGQGLTPVSGKRLVSFIKSRRGIKEIPVLYVTPDTPRPVRSADAVLQLDLGDTDEIAAALSGFTQSVIAKDVIAAYGADMSEEQLKLLLFSHLEEELDALEILNQLGAAARESMDSLYDFVEKSFSLLHELAGFDTAMVFSEQWKKALALIFPTDDMYQSDVDAMMKVSLNDFYQYYKGLNLDDISITYFNIDGRDDFDRLRIDGKKISSYFFRPVKNSRGDVVATLHLGHLTNNFYTDTVVYKIDRFLNDWGPYLDNILRFSYVTASKKKIHHVFTKFVPEEIITSLVEKDTDAELMVGEKRNIVILFSDIRSFTTISETNHPEDVVAFLNQYFDLQVSVIKKHGGNIDKFIGDAIFAIFGAPISYENNVERAVAAAMEMIEVMGKVKTDHMSIPGGRLEIGIGLHEGDAIVGNIGSSTKFDYTAIGDTVNLAARLEGYTKHYHRQVLLSETVAQKIHDSFPIREIDYVKVKGKDIATSLFALEFDQRIMERGYLNEYYKAYKMYRLGNFMTALEYYEELKSMIPDDYILDIFIERCRNFIDQPPEKWDGSLYLEFK